MSNGVALEQFNGQPAALDPAKMQAGELGNVVSFKALASDPAGTEGAVYLNTVSHKLRAYTNGAWADLGSGGGAAGGHAARLTIAFETGGSIAQWQGYPVWTNGVTYGPYGGTRAKGAADFELVAAAAAGDYPVQIVYATDTDILVTIRVRSALGVWSDYGAQTLAVADNRKNFAVTLTAGQSYGLHFAPVGGGAAGLNYFEVWV